MLLPKRVKYRRVHRGRLTGEAHRGNFISHGEYGLQATEPAWITSRQIEAARIAPIFMGFDLLWQWISKDAFDFVTAALQGAAMSVGFTLLQVYWDRKKK